MQRVTGQAWGRVKEKSGVNRFSERYRPKHPRLIRIFDIVLPFVVAMVLLIGLGLGSWQIASLASPGEVKLVLPEADSVKSDDFHVRAVFEAKMDRQPFNLMFYLDEQVIEARVGAAIKEGQVREYSFSSGVKGQNVFDRNLLNPGQHTVRVEARTGSVVGEGIVIDKVQTKFKVSSVYNLAALGGDTKTVYANQLSQPVPSRTSYDPSNMDLWAAAANVSGLSLGRVLDALTPKAEAATRHGNLTVTAPPNMVVTAGHVGSLPACASGTSSRANAQGIATFTDCPVSTQGGTSAQYNVTLRDAVPAEWQLVNPAQRVKQVTIEWQKTATVAFDYKPAPRYANFNVTTTPALPGIRVTIAHVAGVLSGCGNGNEQVTGGDGVARFKDCLLSTQGGSSATYLVTVHETPAGWTINGTKQREVVLESGKTNAEDFRYGPSASAPQTPPQGSSPTAASDPSAAYDYTPSDSAPFISLTNLGTNTATVNAFAAQLQNNITVNYLREVYVQVDGVTTDSVTQFSPYATQKDIGLRFGVSLDDQRNHTLSFIAVSQNGKRSKLDVRVSARQTGDASASQQKNVGSISASVYAHDAAGKNLDEIKDPRVGNTYISVRNIGDGVGQCEFTSGLTDNDRSHLDRFGRIKFENCPAASDKGDNNHAKQYRITLTIPPGPQKMHDGFNNATNATVVGNTVTRDITVRKNQETKVSFLLLGASDNTFLPEQRKTEPTIERKHEGTIAVNVYAHSAEGQPVNKDSDPRVGAVYISTDNVGVNAPCEPRKDGLTDNDREKGENAENFGRIHFKGCPVALNKGDDGDYAKKYKVTMLIPDGFTPDKTYNNRVEASLDSEGKRVTREVTVKKDQETAVSFVIVGQNDNTIASEEFEQPPPPPTNLKLSNEGPGLVRLNWQAPNEPNISGYAISRLEDGSDDWVEVEAKTTSTTYTDNDLGLEGKKYTYSINTISKAQLYSEPVETSIKSLGLSLSNLTARDAGAGVVQLDWKASTGGNVGSIDFAVERSLDNTEWDDVDLEVVGTAYTDVDARFGIKYYYRVSGYVRGTAHATNAITAQITTSQFQPNVLVNPPAAQKNSNGKVYAAAKTEEATEYDDTSDWLREDPQGFIVHDSGKAAKATVPRGAVDTDAQCVFTESNGTYTLPKGKQLNGAAYTFMCKDADGEEVVYFNKPVVMSFPLNTKVSTHTVSDLDSGAEILSQHQKSSLSLIGSPGSMLAATISTGTYGAVVDATQKPDDATKLLMGAAVLANAILIVAVMYRYRRQLKAGFVTITAKVRRKQEYGDE